jgi:BirA family biotin operon repressor/biotin-[acetyl-CoA-carboxylase] ligase
MEAARSEAAHSDFLLVTAETQSRGRGTKGRDWQSPPGNAYFTVGVHRKFLPPGYLRLFPLAAGLELWETAAAFLPPDRRPGLRLKWPNDLLWEERKAAGMLVETAGEHVLVGAGVNIRTAPLIADGGRAGACLFEAGADPDCGKSLAEEFFRRLQDRLLGGGFGEVLREWSSKALWGVPFLLRDRAGTPSVLPLDLNSEGHLRVRFGDGREEWLVSEYLI